jgi:hypothetical protein
MTMHVLCKNCWIKHDAATLLCRCKQCEANTKIERPVPLESKSGNGPFPRARPLVCTGHEFPEPLDIYCRECGKEVSPRALVNERGVVAFVGDRKSGKTSLLWVLSEKLRQENPAGIYIRQPLGDSDEQMAEAVRSILTSGLIEATPYGDADARNYAWEVILPSGDMAVIAFHDAAGELWSGLAKLPRLTHKRFYRYLDLAGSIVFTIDGERISEAIAATKRGGVSDPTGARAAQLHELAIVDAIGRRIRARGVKMPIAAVVTKADMVWGDDRWALFRNDGEEDGEIDTTVRKLLRAAGRQTLLDSIVQNFDPVRFFAVSAFGGAPQQPLRIEDVRPTRVEEPLLALLQSSVPRS